METKNKNKTVCIIGLGYVGLPLAVQCALKGYTVFGLENDTEKNSLINQGRSPIKEEFLDKRMFIHTPKGDIIELPHGSGVIDFAYSVHSDVGNHVAGAIVNGKLVSLNTKLKDNDIVEIMTKEDAKPTRKWIDGWHWQIRCNEFSMMI